MRCSFLPFGYPRNGRFRTVRTLLVTTLLGLLAACGGGGSSDGGGSGSGSNSSSATTAPTAATLALTPNSIKLFHFSWTDVADATEYHLLENPDGASGFTQVATISPGVQSDDLSVFLPDRINARYMLQSCNAIGCTNSSTVTVSGSLAAAVGYIKASNTNTDDYFGTKLALSADGHTLAVGAPQESSNATGVNGNESDNSAGSSGAVYVFTQTNNTWSQQAYVKASNTASGDFFGYSVALSSDGSTLAVGADSEDSAATGIDGDQSDNSAGNAGAVYVFTRSGTTWSQQAYVKASNTGTVDFFGNAVGLSSDGNTLAVGAEFESSDATGIDGNQSDNSANKAGAVYVYTRSGTSWSQQAYVKASNSGANDLFGSRLALSSDGNTLAVGAVQEASASTGINGNQSDNSASNAGAVYVFTRSSTVWSQQAYVKASNAAAGDKFGTPALSADGNTLAVGASSEASAATGVDGDQADNSASNAGAVYVFTRSGTVWSQQAYVKASNTDAGDYFGTSVSLSSDGNTLAVGAFNEGSAAKGIGGDQSDNSSSQSGAAYLFKRSGANWTQSAYIKAPNTHAGDEFGRITALSADADILAVSASFEASNATGIGGNQSDTSETRAGAAYLY